LKIGLKIGSQIVHYLSDPRDRGRIARCGLSLRFVLDRSGERYHPTRGLHRYWLAVQTGIFTELGLNLTRQLAVIRRFGACHTDGQDAGQQNH
jgi:hypothetical protein